MRNDTEALAIEKGGRLEQPCTNKRHGKVWTKFYQAQDDLLPCGVRVGQIEAGLFPQLLQAPPLHLDADGARARPKEEGTFEEGNGSEDTSEDVDLKRCGPAEKRRGALIEAKKLPPCVLKYKA